MYEIMGRLIDPPLLALAPALALVALHRATGSRACLAGAAGWLLYSLYEESVRRRIICAGECNIRVDLLLLYPLLIALSLAALFGAAARLRTWGR
jgi:hypothetical protein